MRKCKGAWLEEEGAGGYIEVHIEVTVQLCSYCLLKQTSVNVAELISKNSPSSSNQALINISQTKLLLNVKSSWLFLFEKTGDIFFLKYSDMEVFSWLRAKRNIEQKELILLLIRSSMVSNWLCSEMYRPARTATAFRMKNSHLSQGHPLLVL